MISTNSEGDQEVGEILVIEEGEQSEEFAYLNDINKGINPVMLRHIVLAETEGVKRLLTGSMDVVLVEDYVEEKEEEKNDRVSKWSYGVAVAPVYTSKRVYANERDNVIVSQYKGINKFNTENTGFNIGALTGYELSPRVRLFGKLDLSKINDNNTFEVAEKREKPLLVSSDNNSFTYSNYVKKEVNVETNNWISGINTSLQYKFGSNLSSYIAGGGGVHYLINSNQKGSETPFENNKLNFSTAIAIGRKYQLTDNLSLNIEPELRYYFKSFQKEGVIESKPYTLGVNFILLR